MRFEFQLTRVKRKVLRKKKYQSIGISMHLEHDSSSQEALKKDHQQIGANLSYTAGIHKWLILIANLTKSRITHEVILSNHL